MSCWRDQQTLNNNVINYEYNCLKLHPWTNIVTMVVWARAKLIFMFYATVIHRLWPRCCLSRRAIGPLKQYNAYFFSFERVVWVIRTIKRCQSTAGAIPGSPPPWCIYKSIHKLCSDPPYHLLLESWARWWKWPTSRQRRATISVITQFMNIVFGGWVGDRQKKLFQYFKGQTFNLSSI